METVTNQPIVSKSQLAKEIEKRVLPYMIKNEFKGLDYSKVVEVYIEWFKHESSKLPLINESFSIPGMFKVKGDLNGGSIKVTPFKTINEFLNRKSEFAYESCVYRCPRSLTNCLYMNFKHHSPKFTRDASDMLAYYINSTIVDLVCRHSVTVQLEGAYLITAIPKKDSRVRYKRTLSGKLIRKCISVKLLLN